MLSASKGVHVLATSNVIAFAPTKDLASARAFYETTLGLRVVAQDAHACVFDAHGTMLRLTAVAEVAHAGYTVLGWQVTNIIETVAGMESLGVVFMRVEGMEQDERGVWTTPGGERIAWFTDPDGNVLSLTQFS